MESYADVYATDTIHIERNLYIKIILVHRLKINCMRLNICAEYTLIVKVNICHQLSASANQRLH